jgi:hypothetical protein
MPERWPFCHFAVSHGLSPGQVPVFGTVDSRAIVHAACQRYLFMEREFISRPVHVRFRVTTWH